MRETEPGARLPAPLRSHGVRFHASSFVLGACFGFRDSDFEFLIRFLSARRENRGFSPRGAYTQCGESLSSCATIRKGPGESSCRKSEGRIPEFETSANFEGPNARNRARCTPARPVAVAWSEVSCFELRAWSLFRVSGFGFRVLDSLPLGSSRKPGILPARSI